MLVAVTLEQCWHEVPGGTATSALDLVEALRLHSQVEPIGVAARHRATPPAPWTPSIEVKHHQLNRTLLYESWHRTGRPKIEEVTGRVDVVHATGVAVPGSDAPLVVTVHDLAFERYPEHPTRWGLRFFRRAMDCARERAAAVICPSQATASDCVAHGFDSDRVHVVPWGLDWPEVDDAAVAAVRQRLSLPERYVLFVGTIEPRKNLPALLAAFAKINDPELHLVLAGPVGWGEIPRPSSPVADRVHFTGFVAPADLRALYRGALVSSYPSLLEGFGLPVLESMTQGTPVVTSIGTATEEVLGLSGTRGGIAVDPHDTGELAAAIASIVTDDKLRAQLSAAASERAAELTPSRMVDGTVAVYRQVLA